MKIRLDQQLVRKQLVATRSQAESYIRLGKVSVENRVITKPGFLVHDETYIKLDAPQQYVSRAGLKLASVAEILRVDFRGKTVLDVGSSTGGFTDYSLKHGARKVIAVDVGTNQLHPTLRGDTRIELHEQTDIRDFQTDERIDIVVADVSFISLREILPHVAKLCMHATEIVAMVKPQFEVQQPSRTTHLDAESVFSSRNGRKRTGGTVPEYHRRKTDFSAKSTASADSLAVRQGGVVRRSWKHKGVIKNDKMRREILKDFETWAKQYFIIQHKADSSVAGEKGNVERFYLLKISK